MKASDYVIQFLAKQGVHHVFQVIGGAIAHLVDSTIDCKDVFCVTTHHEQGAAFAAEGYARCNGKLGAAMATSGPGATNLITGIGSCFFDSVPAIFITGQVNTYEYKFNSSIRQAGFQETDIVSIVKPITKGARLVTKVEELPSALEWAVHLAQSGRPGPVLIDIPMDIQRSEIDPNAFTPTLKPANPPISEMIIDEILTALQKAQRPVILVGGGIRAALASEELFSLIDKTQIPVVASLLGVDAFPHTHSAYAGMIGAYGNRYANFTVANADFLLVLGSRLDTRQTGTRPESFAREAVITHVDIDEHELNRVLKAKYPVKAHLKDFLLMFNKKINNYKISVTDNWLQQVKLYKTIFPSFPLQQADDNIIDPNEFLYQLSQHAANDAIIVLDVGQHQMWAAQSFAIKPKQRMLISGGMGSMGFALPAAIGAAFAEPERQIIVITGDGGFQMNIQELQTIVRNRLAIKIILMNNKSLGMVRQFQQIYFNGRLEGTQEGYDCPNFIDVVSAYGISSAKITAKNVAENAIKELLLSNTPAMLEVDLPQESRVEPKLVVNHPVEDQDPKIPREQLAKLMIVQPLLDV